MTGTFLQPPTLRHRLVVATGVLLVLMLGVLGVRPDLHEALCHHGHPAGRALNHEADVPEHHGMPERSDLADGCVVGLFVHGHASAALGLILLPMVAWTVESSVVPDHSAQVAFGAYRWPPGRGPPCA